MKFNYVLISIFVYILIILYIVTTKPNIIYDHDRQQYRDFGSDNGQSLITFPIIAICSAVLIAIVFCNVGENNKESNKKIERKKIKSYGKCKIVKIAVPVDDSDGEIIIPKNYQICEETK